MDVASCSVACCGKALWVTGIEGWVKRLRGSARRLVQLALLGGTCLAAAPGMARADPLRDEVEQLRDTLRREVAALRLRGERLDRDILRLEEKNKLLDRQLQALRAAGPGRPAAAGDGGDLPRIRRAARQARGPVLLAQVEPAVPTSAPTANATPNGGSAPITGPAQEQQQARRTLETALPLSTTGGVLTPKCLSAISLSVCRVL